MDGEGVRVIGHLWTTEHWQWADSRVYTRCGRSEIWAKAEICEGGWSCNKGIGSRRASAGSGAILRGGARALPPAHVIMKWSEFLGKGAGEAGGPPQVVLDAVRPREAVNTATSGM